MDVAILSDGDEQESSTATATLLFGPSLSFLPFLYKYHRGLSHINGSRTFM
jgi:hypothetical protein